MQENISIHHLMLENHRQIDELVNRLKDALQNNQLLIKKSFDKLSGVLERHFLTEEQAIFTFTEVHSQETQSVVHELLIEHGQMRELMNRLGTQIDTSQSADLNPLLILLNEHQRKENDVLYPKLDQALNDGEKRYIIKKIELISKK